LFVLCLGFGCGSSGFFFFFFFCNRSALVKGLNIFTINVPIETLMA